MTPSLVPLSSLANGTIWALTGGLLTPAAGATAFIYKHGTFTEVTVYTAETGEATLTQPLSAAANGQFPGYVLAEEDLDIVATFEGKTPPAAEAVPLRAADLATKARPVHTISGAAEAAWGSDYYCEAGASYQLTIPTAVGHAGEDIRVRVISGTHTVTVKGAQTIDGAASLELGLPNEEEPLLSKPYAAVTVSSDGAVLHTF